MEFLRLNPDDNVVVAVADIAEGTDLDGVHALQSTPRGHKIAATAIAFGAPIVKYGQVIGFASEDIPAGGHVHMHNGEMRNFERVSAHATRRSIIHDNDAVFQGYRRSDGKVGTRNYIGVLTTVNCAATVARAAADAFKAPGALDDYPNVDGVVALTHDGGCGLQRDGEGHEMLRRVLKGYIRHPNFAGVILIGLGCEVNQVTDFIEAAGVKTGEQFQAMTIQETGGTRVTVERAVAAVKAMLPRANACRRETVSASELTLALQCGGSDGFSGLIANPALGAAADRLVACGGTAILSETPEIYGAEQLLTARAASPGIAEKLMARVRWWEQYVAANNGRLDNNPSPGNKAGGLTTILEKSLGAVAKAGTSPLTDVDRYAEPITARGLVFMDSPGYDPASVTGQIASGANIVCFTTGRGSVFGASPAPSIKLATNTALYKRMADDMDINCGVIVDGEASVDEVGAKLFDLILCVASGEQTKSEALGFGQDEFIPWRVGAVM